MNDDRHGCKRQLTDQVILRFALAAMASIPFPPKGLDLMSPLCVRQIIIVVGCVHDSEVANEIARVLATKKSSTSVSPNYLHLNYWYRSCQRPVLLLSIMSFVRVCEKHTLPWLEPE